jgi:hypothetical protein
MSVMRRLLPPLAAAAAVVSLFPLCAGAAELRPLRLTVAFTADASGYLEPCG